MVADINFSQASAAYKSASRMQLSSAESSATESLDKARNVEYKSESMSAQSLANKAEYHELVTAVNNAELTLRTVVSIRDKMISAYQDIIRMPI